MSLIGSGYQNHDSSQSKDDKDDPVDNGDATIMTFIENVKKDVVHVKRLQDFMEKYNSYRTSNGRNQFLSRCLDNQYDER